MPKIIWESRDNGYSTTYIVPKRPHKKIIGKRFTCIRKTGKDRYVERIKVVKLIPRGYLSKGHMYWVECYLDNGGWIESHMHYMTIKRKYEEI